MTDVESVLPAAKENKLARDVLPFLRETGWIASKLSRMSVTADGEPIPWITYGALHFLESRIGPDLRVFEFGSGNGTIWWARHVRTVVAVEHDEAWATRIRAQLPPNAQVNHIPLETGGEYCRSARAGGVEYDIIVVDGRDRVNSALESTTALAPGGVVVWDNSNRRRYHKGIQELRRRHFRELPFTGLAPIGGDLSRTSVFYRSENCLGI